MATFDASLEQVLNAARRLSAADRERLVRALKLSGGRDHADRSTTNPTMSLRERKRMGTLLEKGNAGTLTPDESRELDGLVDSFERKTLAFARVTASATVGTLTPKPRSRRSKT